ncbi:MAG: hypothetical protein DVB28_000438 [Verrucomicrobia bacterium]|nr:MAG: hypothetical protein DVB28_000438 [Verrucomicrobiota bacterium]
MMTPVDQHQNESFLRLYAEHEASLYAFVRAMLSGRMLRIKPIFKEDAPHLA